MEKSGGLPKILGMDGYLILKKALEQFEIGKDLKENIWKHIFLNFKGDYYE